MSLTLRGKFVLRTNPSLDAAEIALRYKELWRVERAFRTMKSVLDTRPIYHKRDETILGHVFASFLALVVMHRPWKARRRKVRIIKPRKARKRPRNVFHPNTWQIAAAITVYDGSTAGTWTGPVSSQPRSSL